MTTFRARSRRDGRLINSRRILSLGSKQVGGGPGNPLHAGLSVTFAVSAGEDVVQVSARLFYMLADSAEAGAPLLFTRAADGLRWELPCTVGSPASGFPQGLDYGVPQPFELQITITYRGGSKTTAYAFWAGQAQARHVAGCRTREGFAAQFVNACLSGQGYRANTLLFSVYGVDGEALAFWEPDDTPEFSGWALGLAGLSGGAQLETNTTQLLVPDPTHIHVPDAWSGQATGRLRDPFSVPVVPISGVPRAEQLGLWALREAIDFTAGGRQVYTARATSAVGPSGLDAQYPAGKPAIAPGAAGYRRLSPVRWRTPPAPGDRSRTAVPGALVPKHGLSAAWVGDGVLDDGTLIATAANSLSTFIRFRGFNFEPQDRVYFLLSLYRPTRGGPEQGATVPPQLAAPLGVTPLITTDALVEPRARLDIQPVSGISPWNAEGIKPLYTGLGKIGGVVPVMVASGSWPEASLGASLELNGRRSFEVSFGVDTGRLSTWRTLALAAALTAGELATIQLVAQAFVLQQGYTVQPTTPGVVSQFGVVWPHATALTRIACLNLRV